MIGAQTQHKLCQDNKFRDSKHASAQEQHHHQEHRGGGRGSSLAMADLYADARGLLAGDAANTCIHDTRHCKARVCS